MLAERELDRKRTVEVIVIFLYTIVFKPVQIDKFPGISSL